MFCAFATFKNEQVHGSESKLLWKSINDKEMVCHMKSHIKISSFRKVEEVWMKSHQVFKN